MSEIGLAIQLVKFWGVGNVRYHKISDRVYLRASSR